MDKSSNKRRLQNISYDIKANEEDNPIKIVEKIDNDSLSDAIIKNITQIVLIQMDEALKNKNDQIDLNIVNASTTENLITIPFGDETSTIFPQEISDITDEAIIQKIPFSSTDRFTLSTPGNFLKC